MDINRNNSRRSSTIVKKKSNNLRFFTRLVEASLILVFLYSTGASLSSGIWFHQERKINVKRINLNSTLNDRKTTKSNVFFSSSACDPQKGKDERQERKGSLPSVNIFQVACSR